MQNQKKCHENVWLISGTSDGPIIANKLLSLKYVVFVSVISHKAGNAYSQNDKLHIITGKIVDDKQIHKFIFKHKIKHVIDATHPFALVISETLKKVCREIHKPIFRYERNLERKLCLNSNLIDNMKGIKNVELYNKNLLLAIGSRELDDVARHYIDKGVNVFARIIATQSSILLGVSSCLRNSNIAILNPSKVIESNLESYLCKYWDIDYILCRESGGYSQMIWENIILKTNIKLFILKRPEFKKNKFLFSKYDDLIESITKM